MILRIWHGWTTPANAAGYEALLADEVFPGIRGRTIPGFLGIQMLRRIDGDEVEFVTLMSFESWDAIGLFAGSDPEAAVVPPKARALLSRFEERSRHYEVRLDDPA